VVTKNTQYKTHIADNSLQVRSKSEASIIGLYNKKNFLITFDDENGNINLKLISTLIDDMYHA